MKPYIRSVIRVDSRVVTSENSLNFHHVKIIISVSFDNNRGDNRLRLFFFFYKTFWIWSAKYLHAIWGHVQVLQLRKMDDVCTLRVYKPGGIGMVSQCSIQGHASWPNNEQRNVQTSHRIVFN